MISTNQFKNGITIVIDGELCLIIECQHVKPGKGGAFVRTKLKSLKSGAIIDKTFRAGEKVEEAFIEERELRFLYRDGDVCHFMDQESFDEIEVQKDQLGNTINFLKEGMEVVSSLYKGKLVDIRLPTFVELKIEHTEPGLRGDTAKSGSKPAKIETGVTIQVPLFINQGETVRIDTRTGEYVGRV